MPACTANAVASYGDFTCGEASLSRLDAMKAAREPAASGFPAVFGCTMFFDRIWYTVNENLLIHARFALFGLDVFK